MASLLVHGFGLFLLAIVLMAGREEERASDLGARFSGRLGEDVTSLAPGERAGDPFERLNTVEMPSVGREPDGETIRLSELTGVALGEEVRLDGAVAESFAEVGPAALPRLSAPFSGRQGEGRALLVRREGGTVESERAVGTGLDWIARHQRPDGGWSLDTSAQCREPRCEGRAAIQSDAAATGLALLPMLGAGHSLEEGGPYRKCVRRGIEWLVAHQKADGDLSGGASDHTQMYSHAIAAMALCEAYGLSRDERLRGPAQKAVFFIAGAQYPMGGWRYNPGQEGDTSVLGWQMLALRSAFLAELKVPDAAVRGGAHYLDRARADRFGSVYAYQPGHGASPVMTAEALLIRQYLGWGRSDRRMVKGVGELVQDLFQSEDRNLYYWYYATQVLHNIQGEDWERWNARIRDHLVSTQVQGEGCDRGSWDPVRPSPDRWGVQAGRLFTTSLSLLNLEVYYRYLPVYQNRDDRPMAVAP